MTPLKIGGPKGPTKTRKIELDIEMQKIVNASASNDSEYFSNMSRDLIEADPTQPRIKVRNVQDLAESIKAHGVIQPIVVRPHPNKPGRYIIVVGERRWTALPLIKLNTIPVIVKDYTEKDLEKIAAIQVAENDDREDITPYESALFVEKFLARFCEGNSQLAQEKLKRSKTYISDRLIILRANKAVLDFSDEGITNDVDTIVKLKRLYDADKSYAIKWMEESRKDMHSGSLRGSVAKALKAVKTGRKLSKYTPKLKIGCVPRFEKVKDKLSLTIHKSEKIEAKYIFPLSDLDWIIKELQQIKNT